MLNAVVVQAVALQAKFSLSKKCPTNPGNMPIMSTFVFLTARFSVSMSIFVPILAEMEFLQIGHFTW